MCECILWSGLAVWKITCGAMAPVGPNVATPMHMTNAEVKDRTIDICGAKKKDPMDLLCYAILHYIYNLYI